MNVASSYDPAVRGRVQLQLASPTSDAIPSDLLLSLLLAKALAAISAHAAKEWLINAGTSPLALNSGFLMIGAAEVLVFGVSGNAAPTPTAAKQKRPRTDNSQVLTYAILHLAQWTCWWIGVERLGVLKVFLLTQYAHLWFPSHWKSPSNRNALLLLALLFSLCFYSDYSGSLNTSTSVFVGYGALVLNAGVSSIQTAALQQTTGDPARTSRLGMVLSAALSLPFGLYGYLTQHTIITADSATSLLPILLFASSVVLVLGPFVDRTVAQHTTVAAHVNSGWLCAVLSAWFVALVAFGHRWSWRDLGMIVLGQAILSTVVSSSSGHTGSSTSGDNKSKDLTFLERTAVFGRRTRAVIKTILKNDESRRIYYFLCLNFGYMGIQMAWGVWTNSLGLISDSIHMFFDNAALALGLFASVMANWPSNEVFTYGYSRVETLSGFANGLFLILISVFIVFEAIQRLMEPPEMNTNQLLVVSALGLAVNLVGLVATGGHHHHGHSHGHDHGVSASLVRSGYEAKSVQHDHGHGDSHSVSQPHDKVKGLTLGCHSMITECVMPMCFWAGLRYQQHDHSSHGHSHNMSGVFLHVLADTLGSVGVIISTLLINRYGWTGFDPLASIFIAILIFASVVPLVQDSGMLLCLDLGSDREQEVRKALAEVANIEGLASCAAPRFWPKDPDSLVGSIHIQLLPSPSNFDPARPHAPNHYHNIERVVSRVDAVLRRVIPGLKEVDIQVEGADGISNCHCLT